MPGFHWPELIIVIGLALLFFGPKRLPEMGSAVGKTIKEFQKSMREVKDDSTSGNAATLPPAAAATSATLPPANAAAPQPTVVRPAEPGETVTPAPTPTVSADTATGPVVAESRND